MNQGWTYIDRIGPAATGQTALAYYADRYRHSPEPVWRERMARGEITCNGTRVAPADRLRAGQVLKWMRPPWEEPAVPTEVPVLFEDEALLAVEKPAGLPVLPDGGYLENTLVHLLRNRYPDGTAPVPVHRLGRGTSGVLLLARTAAARSHLAAQFRRVTAEGGDRATLRKIYRTATAAVPGLPDTIEIRQPIGPVPHCRLGWVHAATPTGRPACSRCRVLAREASRIVWEIELVTGRPHQIRIHLAAIGAPLLGDPFYGPGGTPRPDAEALPGDIGYALHACSLRVTHPLTGRPIDLHAPIPPRLRTADSAPHLPRPQP